MGKEKLIVILGPTAVGKTALSIELAHHLDTEIISGDSMLVYRGFDIGAAKPTLAERQGIVHHLVDVLPPDAAFNVTDLPWPASRARIHAPCCGPAPQAPRGTPHVPASH